MDKSTEKTERIDLLLDGLIRDYGLDHKVLETQVFAAWKGAVGALIARNTQPISLVNGKLTVYALAPVWVNELQVSRGKIIPKINKAVNFPAVKTLEFSVKPIHSTKYSKSQRFHRPKRLKLETVELDRETLKRIDQIVASVEDPDLKAHLKRLFIKQSQRALVKDNLSC
ncbi:DUF721 domain-containing protein [Candidatus Poribacteria bacterium]|nr:DUF721 domain-containing protein [Candidatus Poribacteria bacterium]